MGSYRLILAAVVALQHFGVKLGPHYSGVSAVVSFYVISGFVMTALIRKSYSPVNSFCRFYLDRAMRLFPQFLFYMTATLILVIALPIKDYFISDLTVAKVALNYLMVPLNFYMVGSLGTGILMPQAWSLGLEALFYLAIPWVLALRLRAPVFGLSAAVFLLACTGLIDTDVWGYRMLPGNLFIFLLGSFMHRSTRAGRRTVFATWAVAVAILALLQMRPDLQRLYSFEVLQGLVVGLPIVALLSRVRFPKFDDYIGNISYGVFLNHFFLIWAFRAFDLALPARGVMLIACSIFLSAMTFLMIERPIVALRHRLRAQRRVTLETPKSSPAEAGSE